MKSEDPKNLLAILVAIQFTIIVYYSNGMFELVNTGAISFPLFLAFVIGNVCLYIGTFRLLLKKKMKGKLFFSATFFLAISLLYLPEWSAILNLGVSVGVLLSISGWWITRD